MLVKHIQKSILCFYFLLFFINNGYGQESIVSGGGVGCSTEGSFSFTVGSMFFTTITGSTATLQQGIQMPLEVTLLSRIDEKKADVQLNLSIYPNPVHETLVIRIQPLSSENANKLYYKLFNINGVLLQSEIITKTETPINLTNYGGVTFILSIQLGKTIVREYKILKTN